MIIFFAYVHLERVVTEMRRLFNVDENVQVRLLNTTLSSRFEPLENLNATIDETGLSYGQTLVLESMNSNGSWPREIG
jgi:hypothetical protein